jgi:hypothetical protein
MRHVRSSLLLVAVALAAALGVWAALSVLVPRGAEPRAPAESSGQSQGLAVDAAATLSDAGSAPALAAPDETAEVDSTAAEILQQQQLAAYGRAQPQRAGTDGGTGGSSVGGGSGVADTIGEAAGALRPSQYHGVVWSPPTQNWKAQYAVESTKNGGSGRTLDLGYFENEEQAAYAYDEAARRRGNGYAPNYALNFPTTERGFVADEILLPSRQKCARVPPDEPLRRPGIGQQLSSAGAVSLPPARLAHRCDRYPQQELSASCTHASHAVGGLVAGRVPRRRFNSLDVRRRRNFRIPTQPCIGLPHFL